MGGNAFGELGQGAFPRIPTDVYVRLKEHFTARLRTLYALVGTPKEAPEKLDHGDIDFIVCRPLSSADIGKVNVGGTINHDRAGLDCSTGVQDKAHAIALAQVKGVLCATHAKLAEGYNTSNFAIPAEDVVEVAHIVLDTQIDSKGGPTGNYYQVDVHVCADEAGWDRNILFKSYGDLGMILGLIARAQGFTLGSKGLRTYFNTPSETHISSFVISQSFDDILPFFGLSMEKWKSGFTSQDDIFHWVKTSRFFTPRRIVTADPSREKKLRNKRDMYTAFLQFSHSCALAEEESKMKSDREQEGIMLETRGGENSDEEHSQSPLIARMEGTTEGIQNPKGVQRNRSKILEECLVHFGKKEEYDAIVNANSRRRALKEKFNGNKIIEWTGHRNGCFIKNIMDKVRESFGNDKIADMDEGEIRNAVLEIRRNMKLERMHSTNASTPDHITS